MSSWPHCRHCALTGWLRARRPCPNDGRALPAYRRYAHPATDLNPVPVPPLTSLAVATPKISPAETSTACLSCYADSCSSVRDARASLAYARWWCQHFYVLTSAFFTFCMCDWNCRKLSKFIENFRKLGTYVNMNFEYGWCMTNTCKHFRKL